MIPFDPAYAGQAAQLSWWGREKQEAAPFIGTTWATGDAQALSRAVASLLDRDGHLFDERLEAGRVVDGHGDLHAQHVYLVADEVQIVDCLEFTDWFQFRIEDVGYDLAFLAMDLEARGHRDLGDELAGRYIAASGDETISVLQPLHRAFRAFVRGKIESPERPRPGDRGGPAGRACAGSHPILRSRHPDHQPSFPAPAGGARRPLWKR